MKRALPLVLLLSGCGSYRKDLQTMCDAPEKSGARDAPEPAEKASKMAKYISDNLSTAEAKTLFRAVAVAAPQEKSKLLRAELDKVGIGQCGLLEVWKTP